MPTAIAVVVPTHNRAELITETLDSILGQTLRPAEIIVVDDGSTDGTSDIVARYAARGVRCLRIDNSGPLVARNVGLAAAQSELVAFCDSDDLWRANFLETAAALWQAAPDLVVSYGNFAVVQGGRWERASKFDAAPLGFWRGLRDVGPGLAVLNEPFGERLIEFQPFFPTGMVVHRRRFQAIGAWDEAVSRIVGCDFATALRVAECPPVGIIQEPLIGIRKHANNISGNVERMNLGNARVLEHVLATRPGLRRVEREIRASIAERRRRGLAAAFARHDAAAVLDIYRLLPAAERRPMTRAKALLAAAPAPIGHWLIGAAGAAGSAKSALSTVAARRAASLRQPALAWHMKLPMQTPRLS